MLRLFYKTTNFSIIVIIVVVVVVVVVVVIIIIIIIIIDFADVLRVTRHMLMKRCQLQRKTNIYSDFTHYLLHTIT
jgi:hypothetical protein